MTRSKYLGIMLQKDITGKDKDDWNGHLWLIFHPQPDTPNPRCGPHEPPTGRMPHLSGHKLPLQPILEESEPVSPSMPLSSQSFSSSTASEQLAPQTNSIASREEVLKQLLRDFDSDKDGKLTPYELKLVSESFAIPFVEVCRWCRHASAEGTSCLLSIDDLLVHIKMWVSKQVRSTHFQDLFKIADTDGSGNLDITEVKSLFSMLGLTSEEEELRKIFEHLDVNNDGTLDDTEFFGLVKYLIRRE